MNFVVFCSDQQRSESLDLYGHPLTQMNNYRRLAQRGAVFENAFCQSVLCTPSRCSFLTGHYPHANGHRSLWHLLQPREPNLFRSLRQAGYHIGHFGKNDVFSPEAASQSLDTYVCPEGSNSGPRQFDADDPRYYSFLAEPHPGGPDGTKDAITVKAACEYLESRDTSPNDPFLCFIPLTLPHPPYGPPEPYHSRYRPEDVPSLRPAKSKEDLERYPAFHHLMRRYRNIDGLSEQQLRQINAIYLGMNDYVDDLFGRILDTVEQSSHLAGNTTIIVMSDHGDFAGDYGLVEKYHSAHYDCKTRVPLIIATPGQESRRIRQSVGLIDLPATIAELAGIELDYTHHSTSLRGLMNGGRENPDAMVFAENGFNLDEPQCFEFLSVNKMKPGDIYYPQSKQMTEHPESMPRTLMARTATEKLILRPREVSEFYDLEKDPRELTNRIEHPDYAERVSTLKNRVLDWLILTSDVTPRHHDARGFASVAWERSGDAD